MFATFTHHLSAASISFDWNITHRTSFYISFNRSSCDRQEFSSWAHYSAVRCRWSFYQTHIAICSFGIWCWCKESISILCASQTRMPVGRAQGAKLFITCRTLDRNSLNLLLIYILIFWCAYMTYCIAADLRTPSPIGIQSNFCK